MMRLTPSRIAAGLRIRPRTLNAVLKEVQRGGARPRHACSVHDADRGSTTTATVEADSQAAHSPSPADAARGDSPEEPSTSGRLRLQVKIVPDISQVSAREWDEVATSSGGGEYNPFVSHAFLLALEASGSAARRRGWVPQHVLVSDADTGALLGCCPMYLKSHSYGEYVFDSSWAQFAENRGVEYYPKLQVCVPFTPVTGPRLMVRRELGPKRLDVLKALGSSLLTIAEELDLSGLHITFGSQAEAEALAELGFMTRYGLQFHFANRGYTDFEHFLGDLKQAKRKSIRQERRSLAKQGLEARMVPGQELTPAAWDRFYSFYLDTVDRKWGTAYLTREFFAMLSEPGLREQVLLAVASKGGDPLAGKDSMVAGALHLLGSHSIFGRHWGCDGSYPGLHFELCYYMAQDEAIRRGLPRVEAGAQGEHKLQRGYLPSLTFSSHFIRDEGVRTAVGKMLVRERSQMAYTLQALTLQSSPFKDESTSAQLMDKLRLYTGASAAAPQG